MKHYQPIGSICLAASLLAGCDGQQYVSHDTASLTISDSAGTELLTACDYIPVLLGANVEKTYVADDLQATISLTRSDIVVTFQGSGAGTEPFKVTTAQLDNGGASAEHPPPGFDIELGGGCAPDY